MDFMRASYLAPSIEIVEQPKKKALRFRYITESRKAGNIYGENHTDASPTYPTIRIYNVSSPVTVMAFCVTPGGQLHPFKLVGDSCTEEGIYQCTTAPLAPHGSEISFTNIGIQCCKKDDVSHFLEQKKRLIPDCNAPRNISSIDMTSVCLMFKVLCSNTLRPLASAISNQITDKKHCTDVNIVKVSLISCEAGGGKEIFILCNKIKKDDIEVVFSHGSWEGYGSFTPTDVFKECAIVCKVPRFHDKNIRHDVKVNLFLREKSSKEVSETPIPFTYTPVKDRYGIGNKRRAISDRNQICNSHNSSQYNSNNSLFIKSELVPLNSSLNKLYEPIYADVADPQKLPIFCLEGDTVALKQEDKEVDEQLAQIDETINSFIDNLNQNEQIFASVMPNNISNLEFQFTTPQQTSQQIQPQLSTQQLTQQLPKQQLNGQQLIAQQIPQHLTSPQQTTIQLPKLTRQFKPPHITQQQQKLQISNPQQLTIQQIITPPQIVLQQQLPNQFQLQHQQQLKNQQQIQNQLQLTTPSQQNLTTNHLPVVSNDYPISIEEIFNYNQSTDQFLHDIVNHSTIPQPQLVSQQHNTQNPQHIFDPQFQFEQIDPPHTNNLGLPTTLQQSTNTAQQPKVASEQPTNLPQQLAPQNAFNKHSQFFVSNNDPLISNEISSFQQWDLDHTTTLQPQLISQQHSQQEPQHIFEQQLKFEHLETNNLQQQTNSSNLETPLQQSTKQIQLEQPTHLPQQSAPQNAFNNHSQFLVSNNDPLISNDIPSFQQLDLDFGGDLGDNDLIGEDFLKLLDDDHITL